MSGRHTDESRAGWLALAWLGSPAPVAETETSPPRRRIAPRAICSARAWVTTGLAYSKHIELHRLVERHDPASDAGRGVRTCAEPRSDVATGLRCCDSRALVHERDERHVAPVQVVPGGEQPGLRRVVSATLVGLLDHRGRDVADFDVRTGGQLS
jgi:hypothetical protein